jgi:hypothetical protein
VHIADLQDQWLRSQQWEASPAARHGARGRQRLPGLLLPQRLEQLPVVATRHASPNRPNPPNPPNPANQPNQPPTPDNPPNTRRTRHKPARSVPPTGIQIVLTLPEGNLMRERELPPL